MAQDLSRAGVVALFGILVSLLPLAAAAIYMVRPTEERLALMRPLSLATIFAALHTLLSGMAAVLRHLPATDGSQAVDLRRIAPGLAETATPMFVAFGLLTVAWLFVAVGMRRRAWSPD